MYPVRLTLHNSKFVKPCAYALCAVQLYISCFSPGGGVSRASVQEVRIYYLYHKVWFWSGMYQLFRKLHHLFLGHPWP